MKPISYKQKTGDMERICTRQCPTGSCFVSILRTLLGKGEERRKGEERGGEERRKGKERKGKERKGKERKGKKGKGREGKGREGKGREGKERKRKGFSHGHHPLSSLAGDVIMHNV